MLISLSFVIHPLLAQLSKYLSDHFCRRPRLPTPGPHQFSFSPSSVCISLPFHFVVFCCRLCKVSTGLPATSFLPFTPFHFSSSL